MIGFIKALAIHVFVTCWRAHADKLGSIPLPDAETVGDPTGSKADELVKTVLQLAQANDPSSAPVSSSNPLRTASNESGLGLGNASNSAQVFAPISLNGTDDSAMPPEMMDSDPRDRSLVDVTGGDDSTMPPEMMDSAPKDRSNGVDDIIFLPDEDWKASEQHILRLAMKTTSILYNTTNYTKLGAPFSVFAGTNQVSNQSAAHIGLGDKDHGSAARVNSQTKHDQMSKQGIRNADHASVAYDSRQAKHDQVSNKRSVHMGLSNTKQSKAHIDLGNMNHSLAARDIRQAKRDQISNRSSAHVGLAARVNGLTKQNQMHKQNTAQTGVENTKHGSAAQVNRQTKHDQLSERSTADMGLGNQHRGSAAPVNRQKKHAQMTDRSNAQMSLGKKDDLVAQVFGQHGRDGYHEGPSQWEAEARSQPVNHQNKAPQQKEKVHTLLHAALRVHRWHLQDLWEAKHPVQNHTANVSKKEKARVLAYSKTKRLYTEYVKLMSSEPAALEQPRSMVQPLMPKEFHTSNDHDLNSMESNGSPDGMPGTNPVNVTVSAFENVSNASHASLNHGEEQALNAELIPENAWEIVQTPAGSQRSPQWEKVMQMAEGPPQWEAEARSQPVDKAPQKKQKDRSASHAALRTPRWHLQDLWEAKQPVQTRPLSISHEVKVQIPVHHNKATGLYRKYLRQIHSTQPVKTSKKSTQRVVSDERHSGDPIVADLALLSSADMPDRHPVTVSALKNTQHVKTSNKSTQRVVSDERHSGDPNVADLEDSDERADLALLSSADMLDQYPVTVSALKTTS